VAFTDLFRAARRAPTDGRSASLSLAETTKRPNTGEIGDGSVSYSTGSGKVRQLLSPEYLWELRPPNCWRIYNQMRFADPQIAGLRRAQNLPLLRASAHMEPAEGGEKDVKGNIENQDAADKADFAQRVLIDQAPWRSFVSDTTLDKDFGFACFEIVWELVDGEVHCRLALRPASSFWEQDVYIENGRIDHVVQHPLGGGEFSIPGEKILWFAHRKEGDDFRGRPILREMYKPWRLKTEVEVMIAPMIGKGGGVPDITELEEQSDDIRAMLDAFGASYGVAAGGYVRHNADVEIKLLTSTVSVADALSAVQYWDTKLTASAQAQVFDLGVSQNGSRALGTTLGDMFTNSIQADASYREDVINAHEGLVHQLIDYNFPNTENLPSLRFGNVQAADLKAMAQAFLWLAGAGMNFGDEDWQFIRSELNMPETTIKQEVIPEAIPAPAVPAPAQVPPPVTPQPSAGDGQPPAGGAQASEAPLSHDTGLQLSELRPPRGVEVYLNLAELVQRFDNAKTAIRDATQATRNALTAELAKRAEAAAAKGDLAKFVAGAPPMVDKLTAEVRAVLTDFYDAGKQQVADELQRQRDGKPWKADAVGNRIAAAEKRIGKKVAPNAAIDQQSEMTARAIAVATQTAAATNAARIVAGVPLAIAAMETAITRESDAAALRFAGTVSDIMQTGRADEATAQAQDVEDAVYSAMLDGSTCDACDAMDGEVTTDMSLAEEWAPNADCEGGDRCRCLVVYEIAQVEPGPTLSELMLAEAMKIARRPIPSPIVNVAASPAPVVNVAAPVVNVAAAEAPIVTVNVPETKRRRTKRDTKFVTDAAGQIVGKVETESEEA
jgi:hypothetical protein